MPSSESSAPRWRPRRGRGSSGRPVGNRQLQASALCATGIVHTALGHAESGIEACQQSLSVAPDPLTRAVALGWLGFSFVEHGDAARAMPALEASVQQHGAFRFPQFQGWFTAFLADAYRLDGRRERALSTAREALGITRAARSPYGVGLALRALGRVQLAAGALPEATSTLHEAGAAFEAMQARYDAARVWMDLGRGRPRDGRPGGGRRALGGRPPAVRRPPRPALGRARGGLTRTLAAPA